MENNLESNPNYREGIWATRRLIPRIELSEYKSIEMAIESKAKLIEHFEENFGFSRTMKDIDSNYAFNLGMHDALVDAPKEEKDES